MKKKSGIFSHFLIAIIAVILTVLLLPIPVIILDILIALNLLLSLLPLLIALRAKKWEDCSFLPTLLLCLILLNLVTAIAAARAIINTGSTFNGIIIGFFASLNSSHELTSAILSLIFFIIFLSVTAVIIAKGSTRVAEIAARFTLDRLPIRLMTIEALFENKKITEDETAAKKTAAQSESDYYSSMDGASKFISGNIKPLIIIFIITIAAGIFIGTRYRNEELFEAIITYCSLAISSGMLTIIPQYILSTASCVAVTKFINKELQWTS